MRQSHNAVDVAPHTIAPSGREACLACPVPGGCVHERPAPIPLHLCPIEDTVEAVERVRHRETYDEALRIVVRNGPLTVRELARRLGIKRNRLDNWVLKGLFDTTKEPKGKYSVTYIHGPAYTARRNRKLDDIRDALRREGAALTVAEITQRTGVDGSTVRSWIHKGELDAEKRRADNNGKVVWLVYA